MINKLKEFLKNNRVASWLFIHMMILIYWFIDHLYPTKKKQIIFTSFAGKQFSDSPKAIYNHIKEDSRFSNYHLLWAITEEYLEQEVDTVNINSLRFLIELMRSKVWISNSSIERLIPYKPKNIIYINTWHGIPLKYIGSDANDVNYITKNWYENVEVDLMTACSTYDAQILEHVFPKVKQLEIVGLPRNEVLVPQYTKIHNPLVVLYAPTFREVQSSHSNMFENQHFFEEIDDVVFLMRSHYFESVQGNNMIDVSNKDLNQLLQYVDLVITDYSSLMFDYALLEKPLLLYPYDLDEYIINRGMYLDYNTLPMTKVYNIDDFKQYINNFKKNYTLEVNKIIKLKEKYQSSKNQGTEYILNFLEEKLNA